MTAAARPPRASVVMVAHNEAEHIGRAIRSIVDQGVADVEIVVVDDGSDDGTADVARSFPGVRVESNPGSGMGDALNHGLAIARSDLIVKIDADDWHLPGSIEALVRPLEADPDVDVVGGRSRLVDLDGRWIDEHVTMPTTEHVRLVSMVYCPIEHTACAFRRDAVLAIGGYQRFRGVDIVEDYDLWIRLLIGGHRFVGIDEVVAVHVVSPGSVTNRRSAMGAERGLMLRSVAHEQWAEELCRFGRVRELGRDIVRWRGDRSRSDAFAWVLVRLAHLALVRGEVKRSAAVSAAALSLGPFAVARGVARRSTGRLRHRRTRGWGGLSDLVRFARGK